MKITKKEITLTLLFLILGFAMGWFSHFETTKNGTITNIAASFKPLRLGGSAIINPLLVCDVGEPKNFSDLSNLDQDVKNIVSDAKASGLISTASVYFQNLKTSHWFVVNDEEKFYPSSLGKLPMMIAYFKAAESAHELLSQKIRYDGGDDLNLQQEIRPDESIVPGTSYTVGELIYRTIKYSDNNADALLYTRINKNTLNQVYADLGVPVNNAVGVDNLDFMTARQYSLFYRILYNATYLTKEESEVALRVLSDTAFKDGLRSGIPSGVEVAHKFGLASIAPQGNKITSRELHDCGIVYQATNPYLLCVMTKTSSTIQNAEQVIRNISQTAYTYMDSSKPQ